MKFVFAKVGDIGQKRIKFVVHGFARQDPAHVGPESAFARGVWVAFFIRVLVMLAVRGDPENRSAFECQCSASGQEIFDPFWGLIATMREQPVIAHANSKASRNPPE